MYKEVSALKSPAKQLIVFLHGFGSSGEDLITLVPFMQKEISPYTHFFAPNGVEPYEMAAFGYQWFSLKSRDPLVLEKKLSKNYSMIMKLIKQKQDELSLDNSHTILVGFSQGTMTSLYLALAAKSPFLGVVGFSGALITPETINSTNTPVCLIHGTRDEVVNHAQSVYAHRKLVALGVKVEQHSIENLAHSIDIQGVKIGIEFIKRNSANLQDHDSQ